MDKFYKDIEIVEQMCLNDVSHEVIVNTINILELNKYYTTDDLKSTEGILSKITHSIKTKFQESKINKEANKKSLFTLTDEIKDGISKIHNLRTEEAFVNKMRTHLFNFNYNLLIDYDNAMKLFHDILNKYKYLISKINGSKENNGIELRKINKEIFTEFNRSLLSHNVKCIEEIDYSVSIKFIKKPNLKNSEKSYDEWLNIIEHSMSGVIQNWRDLFDEYVDLQYDTVPTAFANYAWNVYKEDVEEDYGSILALVRALTGRMKLNSIYLIEQIQDIVFEIQKKVLTKFTIFVHQTLAFAKK